MEDSKENYQLDLGSERVKESKSRHFTHPNCANTFADVRSGSSVCRRKRTEISSLEIG